MGPTTWPYYNWMTDRVATDTYTVTKERPKPTGVRVDFADGDGYARTFQFAEPVNITNNGDELMIKSAEKGVILAVLPFHEDAISYRYLYPATDD